MPRLQSQMHDVKSEIDAGPALIMQHSAKTCELPVQISHTASTDTADYPIIYDLEEGLKVRIIVASTDRALPGLLGWHDGYEALRLAPILSVGNVGKMLCPTLKVAEPHSEIRERKQRQ